MALKNINSMSVMLLLPSAATTLTMSFIYTKTIKALPPQSLSRDHPSGIPRQVGKAVSPNLLINLSLGAEWMGYSSHNSNSYSTFIHEAAHVTLNGTVGGNHYGYSGGSYIEYARSIGKSARFNMVGAHAAAIQDPYVIEYWSSGVKAY